jgi:hypothetical protein
MAVGCIFCGNTPTTREHLVPAWAGKVLLQTKPPPSAPGKIVRARHRRWSKGAAGDRDQNWITKDTPEFVAKCVCEQCNGGWMSTIEDAARPILTAMIEDQRITLDIEDQEKVATWLGLKAIVAQHTLPQGQIAFEWTNAFAIEKRAPTSWQIRIARYQGTVPLFLGSTGLDTTLIHALLPFAIKRPGFLFIAQLGHFVGQVLGMQQQAWLMPPRHFIQVWPHPLLRANSPTVVDIVSVTWPPEGGLDDSDLKKCARDPSEPKT